MVAGDVGGDCDERRVAIPPNQMYSGTSHVQTGALMIGPWTSTGTRSPARARRAAAATTESRAAPSSPDTYFVSSL